MNAEEKTMPTYQEGLQTLVKQLGEMLPEKQFAVFNQDAGQLAKSYASPLKLKQGDVAPLFSLPDATGKVIDVEKLLLQGPLVLTFYRGAWCPYCNLQLNLFQKILPQIRQAGANLVAVSPMVPDKASEMIEQSQLNFDVLSDVGNEVARQYTTVFKNGDASTSAMTELGYDFHGFYGDKSGELPVPATFVIARNGTIVYAQSAGGDYRERVEPQAVLDALNR